MFPPSFTPELMRQLEILRIRSRRAFLGTRQGNHKSPKRGHGIEFSDYRRYELGDNPRSIDWGLYARTDRLYVKQYREEQNLSVLLLLDDSASMGVPGEEEKWIRSRDLTLALGYLTLIAQDTCLLVTSSGLVSPRFTGMRAVHELGRLLCSLTPQGSHNFCDSLVLGAAASRLPGLAFVISDFLAEFKSLRPGFEALRARNLDTSLLHMVAATDRSPLGQDGDALLVDSESGIELQISFDDRARELYKRAFSAHVKQLAAYCNQAQFRYLEIDCGLPLETIAAKDLAHCGIFV